MHRLIFTAVWLSFFLIVLAPRTGEAQGMGEPVYVSVLTGNDLGPGTIAAPKQTLAAGIALATAENRPVYVADGLYNEVVNLPSRLVILGGFDGTNGWTRDFGTHNTVISQSNSPAVTGQSVQNVYLEQFRIETGHAQNPGQSSVAVRLNLVVNVVFNNCVVESGDGVVGQNGNNGSRGTNGQPGQQGRPGCEDSGFGCENCTRPTPGVGGAGPGGRGGNGGLPGHENGIGQNGFSGGIFGSGGASGGGGGSGVPPRLGNWVCGDPTRSANLGRRGFDGGPGQDGNGGQSFGMLQGVQYMPSDGFAGVTDGRNGGGGGGGGSNFCDSYGGSGSGGGAGATGGTRAPGGRGGSGSFGFLVFQSNGVVVSNSTIMTGRGGDGGRGGNGGDGGTGGAGGIQNNYGGSVEQDDGSNGACGGRGGDGGRGGHGGGGGGGPSVGIAIETGSGVRVFANSFSLGDSGMGGQGGLPDGRDGADGMQANIRGSVSNILDDCNNDGVPDPLELFLGLSPDCNTNNVLDVCDIANGTSQDPAGNGIPDECETVPFVRADANGDGTVNIADPSFVARAIFIGGADQPPCDEAADGNDDGTINIADPSFIARAIFIMGADQPPPPFPGCGTDPDHPGLGCELPPEFCEGM